MLKFFQKMKELCEKMRTNIFSQYILKSHKIV